MTGTQLTVAIPYERIDVTTEEEVTRVERSPVGVMDAFVSGRESMVDGFVAAMNELEMSPDWIAAIVRRARAL